MKKLIASAGIAAVGVAGVQAAPQVGLGPNQSSKPWSITASLRGFYDDNITTVPDAVKEESFGIAVSPSISYNVVREQTTLSLGYTFGLRWYEDREPDSSDEAHTVSAAITHDASPSLSFSLSDTFRVAQEPQVTTGTLIRVPIRGDQDYVDNEATISATKVLSPAYSLHVSYSNKVIDFDDAAFSALLDRVEHSPLVHLLRQINDSTVGLIGYRFKAVDYTDDAILGVVGGVPLESDVRDSDSHYVYAGVDHAFTPNLQGSARVGVQFADFNNADDNPLADEDDATSPYVDANLSYRYAEGSNLQFGVKHERRRNDLAFVGGTDPILDQEQTVVYGAINHRITAKLNASLVGTYLNGDYEGGGPGVDGNNDEYWAFGINLNYTINQFLAAEAGYNFDDLESEFVAIDRSYDRNRVYIGLRASY